MLSAQNLMLLSSVQDECEFRANGLELSSDCRRCAQLHPSSSLLVERRTCVYSEGDPANHVYVVAQGLLRETRLSVDGRLQALRLIRTGDIVGTEGMIRSTYQSNVEALTVSRLCRVSVRQLKQTMRTTPSQSLLISEVLCRTSAALRDSVRLLGPTPVDERLLLLLHDLCDRNDWSTLPITRREIGEFIGAAEETISRGIHRLASQGVLEVEGRRIRLLPAKRRGHEGMNGAFAR